MAADAPYIAADDGTYLGEITCAGSKSIANKYGLYGSKYGVDSIWNRYGLYGSQYAVLSPYNRYASKPPKIFYPDDTYAYLTANAYLRPRISPVELQGMLMEKCGLDDPLRDE